MNRDRGKLNHQSINAVLELGPYFQELLISDYPRTITYYTLLLLFNECNEGTRGKHGTVSCSNEQQEAKLLQCEVRYNMWSNSGGKLLVKSSEFWYQIGYDSSMSPFCEEMQNEYTNVRLHLYRSHKLNISQLFKFLEHIISGSLWSRGNGKLCKCDPGLP